MARRVIVDAGPIVAYLDRKDSHHEWARARFSQFPRFETCDAVLAEACARLAYGRIDPVRAVKLATSDVLKINFDLATNIRRVEWFMEKYADTPMDLADACLVLMTEQEPDSLVVTLDHDDFSTYRRNGRDHIPFVSPRS